MARGPALDSDDAERAGAAKITFQDQAEARVFAREALPAKLKGLADATPATDTETLRRRRENDLPKL